MNQIVTAYPDRDLHVVLDNLNTHKPKEDRWLKIISANVGVEHLTARQTMN
jgi:hypothetical protein